MTKAQQRHRSHNVKCLLTVTPLKRVHQCTRGSPRRRDPIRVYQQSAASRADGWPRSSARADSVTGCQPGERWAQTIAPVRRSWNANKEMWTKGVSFLFFSFFSSEVAALRRYIICAAGSSPQTPTAGDVDFPSRLLALLLLIGGMTLTP